MDEREVMLGFCVQREGTVVVGLEPAAGGGPRLVLSTVLALAEPGDDLAAAPYAMAAQAPRGPDGRASAAARAAVEEGRRRQDAMAAAGLAALVSGLRGDRARIRGALLVNRAGWVTDLLDYSLAFADHAAVADGLARREAIRAACTAAAIPLTEIDEKTLEALAQDRLGLGARALQAALTLLGQTAGRPWRREQKRASLAAWYALTDPAA